MSFAVRGAYLNSGLVHSIIFEGNRELVLGLYDDDSTFNWFCTLSNLSTKELKSYVLEFDRLDDGNIIYTDVMTDIVIVGGPNTRFTYSESDLVISLYRVSYKFRVRKFRDSRQDLSLWY